MSGCVYVYERNDKETVAIGDRTPGVLWLRAIRDFAIAVVGDASGDSICLISLPLACVGVTWLIHMCALRQLLEPAVVEQAGRFTSWRCMFVEFVLTSNMGGMAWPLSFWRNSCVGVLDPIRLPASDLTRHNSKRKERRIDETETQKETMLQKMHAESSISKATERRGLIIEVSEITNDEFWLDSPSFHVVSICCNWIFLFQSCEVKVVLRWRTA